VSTAGALESVILGEARYSFDSTEFKSLISISLPRYSTPSSPPTPLLNIILIYEEPSITPTTTSTTTSEDTTTREEASWTFLRLERAGSASPNDGFDALRKGGISSSSSTSSNTAIGASGSKSKWFKTLQEAIESTQTSQTTTTTTTRNRPSPMDFNSYSEGGDYDEYGTRRPLTEHENGRGVNVKQMKTREEMVSGEGTTPGAYGDSADFWAGWSDSEGEEEEDGAGLEKGRGRDTEKEDEENYWKNYGSVEDQVSNGREQEEEDVQQSPTIPQLESAKSSNPIISSTAQAPNGLAKTRSRRSSTVTPFSPKAFLATPPPSTPSSSSSQPAQNPQSTSSQTSFLTMMDSPAPVSQPFQPIPPASNSTTTQKEMEKEDEYLRSALAGVWGMYSKGSSADKEEKKQRFERIVGEVLRS